MKKRLLLLLIISLCALNSIKAQIGIATDTFTPHTSAMLEVKSYEAGMLIPRINDSQRDALPSPATGLIIFNTTSQRFNYWDGSGWQEAAASFLTTTTGIVAFGDGIAINLTDSPAEASAILDVSSDDKGVLIPRTLRTSIVDPAAGLLIFNTATGTLDYYDGTDWQTPCLSIVSETSGSGTSAGTGTAINLSGGDPHNSAMLEVEATNMGVLIPRQSDAERNQIDPAIGLLIYNTTSNELQFYTSSGWYSLLTSVPEQPSEIAGETTPLVGSIQNYSVDAVDGVTYTWDVPANWTIDAGQGTHSITVTVGEDSGGITVTPSNDCGNGTARTLTVIAKYFNLGPAGDYFIASIYDEDYLPYTVPTGPAILPGTANDEADGTPDTPTIDYQGTLTTTGVIIKIPYTVVGAIVELTDFSQTINIPEELTEDGISRNITLEWGAQSLTVGSGTFDATLKAEVGTLNARKLDIQTGIGDDYLGLLLAQFTYPSNNSGGTENFQVRLISAIPDRNFGVQTTVWGQSPAYNHQFLYIPVYNSATGETWLNNNLGANYANLNHAQFNPAQQATASTDWHAYGSFYQWGRLSDSHELINRTGVNTATVVNPNTSYLSLSDTPADARFITTSAAPHDWRNPENPGLWQGVSGTNKPCPTGWRLPTDPELNAERLSWGTNNAAGAFASTLKLTMAGIRIGYGSLVNVGSNGYYWSSTVTDIRSQGLFFLSNNSYVTLYWRVPGFSVRCIKDLSGTIESLNCTGATHHGILNAFEVASGVSSDVPYTGGNGGSHNGQTASSSGVTGLTATLEPGVFAVGAGVLTYTITGTAASSGVAIFDLDIGGQTCTITRDVVEGLGD